MRQIPASLSFWSFWEDLVFLEAALLAYPPTADFAAQISTLLDEGEQLAQAERQTTRARLQARARGAIADNGLDDALDATHNDALHHVNRDRKQPAFAKLFSQPISTLVRFSLSRQVKVVEDLLKRLSLPLLPPDLTQRAVDRLNAALTPAREAWSNMEATALETARHRLRVTEWKADVNAARVAVYGDLLKLAASGQRPKAWASRFFKPADDAAPSAKAGAAPKPSSEGASSEGAAADEG